VDPKMALKREGSLQDRWNKHIM